MTPKKQVLLSKPESKNHYKIFDYFCRNIFKSIKLLITLTCNFKLAGLQMGFLNWGVVSKMGGQLSAISLYDNTKYITTTVGPL